MNSKTMVSLACVALCAFYLGCKPAESDSGRTKPAADKKGEKSESEADTSGHSSKDTSSGLDLTGTWTLGCTRDGERELYQTNVNTFSSGSVVKAHRKIYQDEECTQLLYAAQGEARYDVVGSSKKFKGFYDINYKVLTTKMRVVDKESFKAFEELITSVGGQCAKVKFSLNAWVDWLPCLEAPTTFDVIKIENDKMYGGDCSGEGKCIDEKTRAASLDKDEVFVRSK